MDDSFTTQKEALAGQNPTSAHALRGTSRSYRMMQDAIRKAALGRYVLVLCENRDTVYELNRTVPLEVSRFLTVRCVRSHPDIDWVNWVVPGWEDHELIVDHWLIQKKFPKLIQMLNY